MSAVPSTPSTPGRAERDREPFEQLYRDAIAVALPRTRVPRAGWSAAMIISFPSAGRTERRLHPRPHRQRRGRWPFVG